MPVLGPFKVSLDLVQSRSPTAEYDVKITSSSRAALSTATCLVVGDAGRTFAIQWRWNDQSDNTDWKYLALVEINDNPITCRWFPEGNATLNIENEWIVSSSSSQFSIYKAPFMFQPAKNPVDEHPTTRDMLGTVKLTVLRLDAQATTSFLPSHDPTEPENIEACPVTPPLASFSPPSALKCPTVTTFHLLEKKYPHALEWTCTFSHGSKTALNAIFQADKKAAQHMLAELDRSNRSHQQVIDERERLNRENEAVIEYQQILIDTNERLRQAQQTAIDAIDANMLDVEGRPVARPVRPLKRTASPSSRAAQKPPRKQLTTKCARVSAS